MSLGSFDGQQSMLISNLHTRPVYWAVCAKGVGGGARARARARARACAYRPITSDRVQSLASETTRKKYYCSSGSILFKFMNILFKKYLAISLCNFYDYFWHLHSMGQPGC